MMCSSRSAESTGGGDRSPVKFQYDKIHTHLSAPLINSQLKVKGNGGSASERQHSAQSLPIPQVEGAGLNTGIPCSGGNLPFISGSGNMFQRAAVNRSSQGGRLSPTLMFLNVIDINSQHF